MTTSITDKTYKKLTIQVSLTGLSFCVFDTLKNEPTLIKHIYFANTVKDQTVETSLSEIIKNNTELSSNYDEKLVIHYNALSTLVPVPLFDENYLGSYLQYNTKVFETDFFTFDEIKNYEMNNVYIPYVNMNNYFIDLFGTFEYKHANTILISKLLDLSKNNEERTMFIHKTNKQFEIIVVQNQKLLLSNSFEYNTPEDFIYYILFTAEQLQLNPENFKLELLGDINENDTFFQIAYKYIRNTSLFSTFENQNSLSEKENREHFILINS